MKTYKHNLSNYRNGTADLGKLYPVGWSEVLPNDTFDQSTSALVRFDQMVAPAMHPVEIRMHHFFVPYRLVWSDWEDFITGKTTPTIPTVNTAGGGVTGTLTDYLGYGAGGNKDLNALAHRVYNSIWNHYFRDQDLQPEISLDNLEIQHIAWQKDQYTAARPSPQQGTAITVPITTAGSVVSDGTAPTFTDGTSTRTISTDNASPFDKLETTGGSMIADTPLKFANSGLTATGAASSLDIISFRRSLALQREKEARSRYGDEHVDLLRYMGANPQDSRLQRPEYLAGGKTTVSFSEVLATNSGFTGQLYGHGIASIRSNRYRRNFPEHGIVMTMMSARPKAIYQSGLPRFFSKTTKEDFFFKEYERIGQREVYNKEVYAAHSSPDGVLGFNNRYQEYREIESQVVGEMRVFRGRDDYHFARTFTSDIALNSDFIECEPDLRPMASSTTHPLIFMAYNKIAARRIVAPNPEARAL